MMEATETKDAKVVNSGNQGESRQIIVFRQGNEEYGLFIDQIKEVVLTPNVTKMPQTPPYIKGVANVRGNIIAILDLEQKFGLADAETGARENGQGNYTLVVASDTFKVGILVTEVPNTLSVSMGDIEESLNVGQGDVDSNYIKGIVKLKDRLVILIDIFKILSEQEIEKIAHDTQKTK